jgi:hypothetical protein
MNSLNCPKKEILSSLIYIQRLINKGDLILNNDTAENISETLTLIFQNALMNRKKFDNNKKNYSALNMYAKSVFYSFNYEKESKGDVENIADNVYLLKDKKFFATKENTDKKELFYLKDKNKIYNVSWYSDIESNFYFVFERVEKSMDLSFFKKYFSRNDKRLSDVLKKILNITKDIMFFKVNNEEDIISLAKNSLKTKFLTKEKFKELLLFNETDFKERFRYNHSYLDNHSYFDIDSFVNDLIHDDEFFDKTFDVIKLLNDNIFINRLNNILVGPRRYIQSSLPEILSENYSKLKLNNELEIDIIPFNDLILADKGFERYKIDFYTLETDEDLLDKYKKISLKPTYFIRIFFNIIFTTHTIKNSFFV